MGIPFDTVGNWCAQIRVGALPCVEVLPELITGTETSGDLINVVAVSDFGGRP